MNKGLNVSIFTNKSCTTDKSVFTFGKKVQVFALRKPPVGVFIIAINVVNISNKIPEPGTMCSACSIGPSDLHQGCPADLRGLFSLMTQILQVIMERATILSAESAYRICAHLRESFPAACSVSRPGVSEKISVMDVAYSSKFREGSWRCSNSDLTGLH